MARACHLLIVAQCSTPRIEARPRARSTKLDGFAGRWLGFVDEGVITREDENALNVVKAAGPSPLEDRRWRDAAREKADAAAARCPNLIRAHCVQLRAHWKYAKVHLEPAASNIGGIDVQRILAIDTEIEAGSRDRTILNDDRLWCLLNDILGLWSAGYGWLHGHHLHANGLAVGLSHRNRHRKLAGAINRLSNGNHVQRAVCCSSPTSRDAYLLINSTARGCEAVGGSL